jgi:hypothetical protein
MAALFELMLKEFRRLLARLAVGNQEHLQRRLRSHVRGAGQGGGAAVLAQHGQRQSPPARRLMSRRDPPHLLSLQTCEQIFPLLTAASMSSRTSDTVRGSAQEVCEFEFIASQTSQGAVRRKRTFADACIELYYELCETPGCTCLNCSTCTGIDCWDSSPLLIVTRPAQPIEHMVGTMGQDQRGGAREDKHSRCLKQHGSVRSLAS